MKGVGLKSNKDKKYNDKFWDKLDKLEKIDSDIALEIKAGKRVKIIEDSEGNIDLPEYPSSGQGYRAIQRLLQFDHIVQPKKGIKKIVNTMVVQPVTVDKQKKYALYMRGRYEGVDAWDSPMGCGFSEGFHYSPKLQFVVTDIAKPFDEKTGERRGEYRPVGYSIIHDIFIPENPKERRKFLENMIKEKNLIIDNCVFSYRQANPDNHHASNHGQISFNNLCDLTFDQLAELQEKTYYKDGSNLYDKDGYTVKYNDGKIQAIK